MLKKMLLPAALLLALLAPGSAFADYVCGTQYYAGANARIKLITSTATNCGGVSTTWWICEPTSTSTSCATARYSVDELLSLERNLVSAADSQQYVAVSTTNCTGGALGCLYSVTFRQ